MGILPVPIVIDRYAKMYNLDPAAVKAIGMVEGGLRRNAVGDNGTSFGPFQLHIGGALPRGASPQWAGSDAGIAYAMRKMAESGAAGLRGSQAIQAISSRFERPADVAGEVRKALGYYGKTPGNVGTSFAGLPSAYGGGGGGGSGGAAGSNQQALIAFLLQGLNQQPRPFINPLSYLGGT